MHLVFISGLFNQGSMVAQMFKCNLRLARLGLLGHSYQLQGINQNKKPIQE